MIEGAFSAFFCVGDRFCRDAFHLMKPNSRLKCTQANTLQNRKGSEPQLGRGAGPTEALERGTNGEATVLEELSKETKGAKKKTEALGSHSLPHTWPC